MREVFELPGHIYSDNKPKFKSLFSKHGVVYDKSGYGSGKFTWKSDKEEVEGVFKKDEAGVTIHSTLSWSGEAATPLLDALKDLVVNLGGSVGEGSGSSASTEDALKTFDDRWFKDLVREEYSANCRNYYSSPLLSPMIHDFLTQRKEKFGDNDLLPNDVAKKVNKMLDDFYSAQGYSLRPKSGEGKGRKLEVW